MSHLEDMEWAEQLPPDCPPGNSFPPNEQTYYRLVSNFPPTEKDFYSQRMLYPEKDFRVDECRARAISLFTNLRVCEKVRKLPTQRNNRIIVELVLKKDCGVILRTGQQAHHSWWRRRCYNPIPDCAFVSNGDQL